MATIKAIDSRSVHQIQSGQVIVDLQSVCKELVENSIDAGATAIEVRFKNYGLDAIEVQDNGSGISPDDYPTIALKHYTSKLATYDDLASLQTFGFRGEALSSLCALAKFHIITSRVSDGAKGTRLDFELSGKLKGTSVVAAKPGTTVVVETLFHNLPVRRKELEKNIKREYNKVLQLLNAYACISVGVKFSVSNHIPKGKKTVAFATNANTSTRDNISNVYGAKTVAALIPLNLEFTMDSSSRPGATQNDAASRAVKIVGHISRPVLGEGRQTPDRQMFFVNSRPCSLPQVAKAFNEVYKSYNMSQSPFVFADMKLDTNAYDVNVSPDKRTIMLHDQTVLLESLKESLMELFEGHEQSVPRSRLLGNKTPSKPVTIQPRESTTTAQENDQRDTDDSDTDQIARPRRVSAQDGSEVVCHSRTTDISGHDSEEGVAEPARSRSQSPLFEPEADASNDVVKGPQPSSVFQHPNARVASQSLHLAGPDRPSASSEPDEQDEGVEQPVPAIKQTLQKPSSQSTIQNAFDRMRSMRTPTQQATITVGATTTVSTIGTTRRSIIHMPKSSPSGKPLNPTPSKSLFKKGLSGFSAPGTRLGSSEEEEIEEEEDENGEQNSVPRGHVRSPSLQERLPTRALEDVRSDDLAVSSKAFPARPTSVVDALPDAGPLDNTEKVVEAVGSDSDEDYEDEDKDQGKGNEDNKITELDAEAEADAVQPSEMSLKRANKLFDIPPKKYWILNLKRVTRTDTKSIARQVQRSRTQTNVSLGGDGQTATLLTSNQPNADAAEERLSLTVTKADFGKMRIVGQFNLGFIIAVRPPTSTSPHAELFIIDQHASDEKYNFERLAATTKLVSQRLVHPHPIELTAVEQEIALANKHVLTANGFVIELNTSEGGEAGHRAKLTSLPMSREVTFTPSDLEELLALIMDNPPSSSTSTSLHMPRPSKVRKLLASRACRSSVMIGKTLKPARMKEIVRHMGSMDKPWSCPHGRPTMRHLLGLDMWQGWKEGDGVVGVDAQGEPTDWGAYLNKSRA
ncbi:hypothetical protein yc1106_02687 [Curvularia clavata]|uniref:DNA mismatch repair protein PMS1 n=1 Tax=Curvularia clavata TaxID=95742 RepID=A0A9Q9DPP3_CURCL|nr:hypothetical protein yc1106_02687 [Curvularia clavata]